MKKNVSRQSAEVQNTSRRGFTLVELLVAIGIFSILVAIGVGGFVNALHTQREVAALIATQSNASIALEQMAREIRTGYLFCNGSDNAQDPACVPNVLGEGTGCTEANNVWTCNDVLDFYNANGDNVDYELQGGGLARSASGPQGTFTAITGDNVHISRLTFTIFGNTEGDNWPPRITVSLGVEPSSTDPELENNVLNLQTTISAREIDCTQTGTVEC